MQLEALIDVQRYVRLGTKAAECHVHVTTIFVRSANVSKETMVAGQRNAQYAAYITLLCKHTSQYLITSQVSRYCLLALHGNIVIISLSGPMPRIETPEPHSALKPKCSICLLVK